MKNLLKQIEKDYSFDNYAEDLKKYFSIDIDTLTFEYKGDIYDFNHLMNFTWIIKYKLNEIEQQLEGKVKFHIAYYKRPSVGFLIGTLFRTEGIVIYQNNDYEDTFEKVANINSRRYKEKIGNFTKYKVIENIKSKNESNILVVINSASHKVNLRAKSLKKYKNIITVNLIENGTIPYESDWTIYANEIYNILNDLQTRYTNITIAHSMPEAIAVILGMGSIAIAIPALPGGVGTYDAGIKFSLILIFSVSSEKALAFALVSHAANYFPFLIIGAIYFILGGLRLKDVGQNSIQ